MAETNIQQGLGIELLNAMFANQNNGMDFSSLLGLTGDQKDLQMQRLMHSFGSQGKPMRVHGMNGGVEDPLDNRSGLHRMDDKNARSVQARNDAELATMTHAIEKEKLKQQMNMLKGGQADVAPTDPLSAMIGPQQGGQPVTNNAAAQQPIQQTAPQPAAQPVGQVGGAPAIAPQPVAPSVERVGAAIAPAPAPVASPASPNPTQPFLDLLNRNDNTLGRESIFTQAQESSRVNPLGPRLMDDFSAPPAPRANVQQGSFSSGPSEFDLNGAPPALPGFEILNTPQQGTFQPGPSEFDLGQAPPSFGDAAIPQDLLSTLTQLMSTQPGPRLGPAEANPQLLPGASNLNGTDVNLLTNLYRSLGL